MCFPQLLILNLKDTILMEQDLSNKCKIQKREILISYSSLKDCISLPKVLRALSSHVKEVMTYSKWHSSKIIRMKYHF